MDSGGGSSSLPPPHSGDPNDQLSPVPETRQTAPEARRPSSSASLTAPSEQPGTPTAEGHPNREYFAGGSGAGHELTSTRSIQSMHSHRSRQSERSPSRLAPDGAPLSRPVSRRQSSIRLRRDSSASNRSIPRKPVGSASAGSSPAISGSAAFASHQSGRPRSISQPERGTVPHDAAASARQIRRVPQIALPRLTEEGSRPTMEELGVTGTPISPTVSMPEQDIDSAYDESGENDQPNQPRSRLQRMRRASRAFWPGGNKGQSSQQDPDQVQRQQFDDEYGAELVDWLDIIDPEVQTLSTLTNVQNSLFVPDLGNWLNRRPTYTLSRRDPPPPPPPAPETQQPTQDLTQQPTVDRLPTTMEEPEGQVDADGDPYAPGGPSLRRSATISSRLTDSHYAALPHGTNLDGWTADEKWELDDHVRHMLHSRRSRFKRTMKGFGQYVRRPLGFLVTLYATLITLFGLAWVLFLIGWIYVGSKQVYVIFIIDSVLVALFACMGIGLAPFRAVDTYRMIFIVRYTNIIEKAKKKRLEEIEERRKISAAAMNTEPEAIPPETVEQNTVMGPDGQPKREPLAPLRTASMTLDPSRTKPDGDPAYLEERISDEVFEDPLTPKQRKRLEHHQKKLARSHSFYKPHETYTHNSFPLGFLIAIVILCDCHSCLQISLSSCTWGISYHTRPFALTTVILCVSITCNITAGIVIMIGDRKTRKKNVVNLLNRQELTGDAIKHLEKQRQKEHEKQSESDEGSRDRTLLHPITSKQVNVLT